MTKKNIINSIRNYNIKGYSKLKKSDLINHIMKPIHRPFHKLILRNLNKTTIDKKKVVKIPKEHKKHHTKKHIEVMKKEMKKGKSFKKAHDIAVKEDKKEKKKKNISKLFTRSKKKY